MESYSRLRWLLVAVLFAATALNYLDRQSLSVLAPLLSVRLQMSNEQYGRVLAAFMFAYTLMNGVWGPFIDRVGGKTGYLISVLWWSVAEILHVFVRSVTGLGVCRFLLGAGEAGNWPAAVKVVAEWFPPEQRSLAAGLFNSGSSVGAVAAPPAIVWITLRYGWRSAFVVVGVAGLVWVAFWAALYRPRAAAPDEIPTATAPLRTLLGSRFMWQFTIAKIFFDPVWYFFTFWYPKYLASARGYSLQQIGAMAWIPFAAAGIGNLAGGLVGGAWVRRSATALVGRKRASAALMLLMCLGFLVAIDPSNVRSMISACVVVFSYTAALANLLALPGDLYSAGSVASVWGLASVGAGLGGMIFSVVTGWMVDRWSFSPVFVVFSVLPLIAAAGIWLLPGRSEEPPGSA